MSKAEAKFRSDWPFDQGPNVGAFTTRQVFDLRLPIVHVSHHSDDHSWSFLCGTTQDYKVDAKIVCMAHLLDMDDTLRAIADLPPGRSAVRKDRFSEWDRYPDDAA